jgi:DNA-binding transcriptional LysR family regulator
MPPVNLSAMDLNLLVVLDALLAEKSVSRAAKRIHSTQPAVSRALGRLRSWFGDPLLTRSRQGMVPTPLGLAIEAEVHAVLEHIKGLVEREDRFDPASSDRAFRATMSDYAQYILCGALLPRLVRVAPRVSFEVMPWSLGFPAALESGALDLAICPPTTLVPGLRAVELLREDLVVVVRKGHPAGSEPFTAERYAALDHVQGAPNGRAGSIIDDLLEARGLARRVVLTVPGLVVLPSLVAGSDCCATLPRRLASAVAAAYGLAVLPLPVEAPAISLTMMWHDRVQQDPGHVWLRGEVQSLFATRPKGDGRRVSRIDLTRRSKMTL